MNDKLLLIIPFLLFYGGISSTLLGVFIENKGRNKMDFITILGYAVPITLFLWSLIVFTLFYYDVIINNKAAFLLITLLAPFLCIISGYLSYYELISRKLNKEEIGR